MLIIWWCFVAGLLACVGGWLLWIWLFGGWLLFGCFVVMFGVWDVLFDF